MVEPRRGSVMERQPPITERSRFWRIAGAGAAFQAGSAATGRVVDQSASSFLRSVNSVESISPLA